MSSALLIRRRGMMQAQQGGVPYDSKVEFLQLTAQGPVINLIHEGLGFAEIDAQGVTTSSNSQVLFCTRTDANGGSWVGKPSYNYWGLGNNNITTVPITTRASISVTVFSNGMTAVVNGETATRNLPSGNVHYDWRLFAVRSGSYPFLGKVYSFKGYDSNNVLFRDLIPVRVGTVGYMYDSVSGQLFGNEGTGNFVIGPDIV